MCGNIVYSGLLVHEVDWLRNAAGEGEMTTPLLTTKLYIPPVRPELVLRPRLIERLNAGLRRKLTLISAPAGFGKTTLLSEWAGGCERPVAWVSLDEGDNDLVHFFAYLIAALQRIEESIGRGILDALRSPQPPPAEEILTAFINQIDPISKCFVLILDDYHVIQAQPIHDTLTFLLEHLPPNLHLVIGTRADPPLPLARLRGRGQLGELRQSDLSFSIEEASTFLNQVMGLALSVQDTVALTSRTEGWIASLQMAALSIQGRPDVSGFIKAFTGSRRLILDYLVEEVLDGLPSAVQDFLLKTSILERMTGPLCDAVTGGQDGHAVLAQLERANLFLIPLDDELRWYRYHHLFADLLRVRLAQTQSSQVPVLHHRASQWYEHHARSLGQFSEENEWMVMAIDHALAGGDLKRAVLLIGEQAGGMLARGEHTTLLGWLKVLPDELVRSEPHLCVYYAAVLFASGQLDRAELYLQAAERVPGSLAGAKTVVGDSSLTCGFDSVGLQGIVAVIHAYSAFLEGDALSVIRFSDRALEILSQENTSWYSLASISLGNAYALQGELVAASQAHKEALRSSKAGGHTFSALISSLRLASDLRILGQLHQTAEICRQGVQLANESGLAQTARAGGLFAVWGDVLREWNDLDSALDKVKKSCELCEQQGHEGLCATAYAILLRVAFARRDWTVVRQATRELERLVLAPGVPVWIEDWLVAWKARLWITRGRWQAAAQFLEGRGLSADDRVSFQREFLYRTLARVLILQGKLDKALELLARLLKMVEAVGAMSYVIEILALQAVTLWTQGKVGKALTILERLLFLAEPEGFVRVFLDEGNPMARLLYEAAARGIAQEYVGQLLASFASSESLLASRKPGPEMVEPLSDRELEVLQHVAEGLSNREIALKLCIAHGTVKNHLQNIYGKLQVHNRTQAVARSREWGLLA